MAKTIVITSGKGGVGKTTSSASISTGLALKGHKTVVIDFDVGLRNLDLIMNCERRVVYDFVNVINGEATLKQAMRFAVSERKISIKLDVQSHASLLMCFVIGSWHLFVKSEFRRAPIDNWHLQRETLLPQALC